MVIYIRQEFFILIHFYGPESQNIFSIDSTIGLGNGFMPKNEDSLRSIIDSLEQKNAF